MRHLVILLVLAGLSGQVRGQSTVDSTPSPPRDSSAATEESPDWLVLPFASYAPSTKVSGGVVVGVYLPAPPEGRPSSVEMTLQATQRRQLVASIQPELYLNGGRWRVQGELLASKYPNVFYGLGGDTPATAKEEYTARYGVLDVRAERHVRSNLRVGPRMFVRLGTVSESDAGGRIDRGVVPGAEGGFHAGLGLSALWDDRNTIYDPTSGTYAQATATWYSHVWGSEHTFGHLRADVRGYRPVGRGALAVQVFAEGVVGRAPFQLLPLLGGADRLRGYREGRFRDRVYWTAQAEYRMPLFWRLKGTVFGAAGEVGPRIGADLATGIETAVGVGGRMRLTDGGVHGRVDLAYSRTGVELYIALGEAF